jgi:hypothetical protein
MTAVRTAASLRRPAETGNGGSLAHKAANWQEGECNA